MAARPGLGGGSDLRVGLRTACDRREGDPRPADRRETALAICARANPAGDGEDIRLAGLVDDPKTAWPAPGLLRLGGFTYGWIEPIEPTARPRSKGKATKGKAARDGKGREPSVHEVRLAWLERQFAPGQRRQGFNPQPYEHLAKILREEGRDRDADKVARAKRDMYPRHATDPAWSKAPVRLMKCLGHGYSRGRAIVATLAWWGVGIFWIAVAVYTGDARFVPTHPAAAAREAIADLAQVSDCRLESEGFRGGGWQVWRAFYQLIGAVIFAVLGVAFTRLVRKD
jgi:hypothetical protein